MCGVRQSLQIFLSPTQIEPRAIIMTYNNPQKLLTLAWKRGMLTLELRMYLEVLEAFPGLKFKAR